MLLFSNIFKDYAEILSLQVENVISIVVVIVVSKIVDITSHVQHNKNDFYWKL